MRGATKNFVSEMNDILAHYFLKSKLKEKINDEKKGQALASVSKLVRAPSRVPKDFGFDSSPFLSL